MFGCFLGLFNSKSNHKVIQTWNNIAMERSYVYVFSKWDEKFTHLSVPGSLLKMVSV